MAVQPQTPYIEHIANGTTTGFNLGFDCDDQDHLIVLVNDVETVFGSWSLVGGAVVFGAAPTSGKKITIQRNTPFERERDFQSYDNSFRPPAVNKDFDRLWWKSQELGVADWLLGLKIQKFRDDVNLTALEETLEQSQELRDSTAVLAGEVENNVAQSQTLLADTISKANQAEASATAASTANTAAQQAVVQANAAEGNVYAALTAQTNTVNTALVGFTNGASKFYPTLAEANADIANIGIKDKVEVGEVANGGTWYKATAGATSLTKSPYDPVTQSKSYIDGQSVIKPTTNRTEKNLNNLSYGVDYYGQSADITLANNFPVANIPTLVHTYKTDAYSVEYQRAILPSNPIRIFDRAFTGTWSAWSEGTNKAYVDAVSARLDSNQIFLPVANPADKNINNLGYSLVLFNILSDLTPANNFPRAAPSLVFTYTAGGSSTKYQRVVTLESSPHIYDRVKISVWSEWIESLSATAATVIKSDVASNKTNLDLLEQRTFSMVGTNLLDKAKIVVGEYVSPSTSKIVTSGAYLRSNFIPVIEGQSYTQSGVSAAGMTWGWYASADKTSTALSVTTGGTATATAPVGAKFVVINIAADAVAKYENTAMLVKGLAAVAYVPYKSLIAQADIQDAVGRSELLTSYSFNLIDPSKVNFTKRYSTGSKNFVTDTVGMAASDWLPVIEGEWYTLSGAGKYSETSGTGQGGYFTAYGNQTAVENINFVAPVDSNGHAFKVPTGLGITHVVVSLKKLDSQASATTLHGNVQLELGEMATAYKPYDPKPQIKSSLLPNNSGGGSGLDQFDDASWYKYVKADGAKIYQDKLPKFRKAMLLKDSDVVVVNSGTSLTARTSEHSTLRDDATYRPPMMHSNAFCSHIWDTLKWEGQQYRRYDSAYFTEVGSFNTSSSLPEWDDGAYRDGLTRYSSTATASVSFVVPINAWQFNFIYRTDSLGCDAKVSVAEGVGKLQIYDEATSTWVEAHNYEFSQLEATPVTRTVNVPSTVTTSVIPTVLASKGNTTYQKRLKMRCRDDTGAFKSLDSVKNVTISRTGGGARFMYWGVEWSPRQYMVTYINAARGSHNTSATGATGLPRFQDNEIWGFKPTLILSELGIHNDGAAAAGVYPVGNWAGLAHNYVTHTDYELSMFSRAAHFGIADVEYAFFTASIAWNFNGIAEDGSLKHSLQTSSGKGKAKMMSALDKYQEASEYLNSIGIPCIDAAYRWVEAGYEIFGDLKTATLGSGKGGATFTNEGSHWNDTGSAIVAKIVLPII